MEKQLRLTLTELGRSIQRQFGVSIPIWKLRRIVDALESADSLEVQRIGLYRTVAADDVGIVADELRRLGWLKTTATTIADRRQAVSR